MADDCCLVTNTNRPVQTKRWAKTNSYSAFLRYLNCKYISNEIPIPVDWHCCMCEIVYDLFAKIKFKRLGIQRSTNIHAVPLSVAQITTNPQSHVRSWTKARCKHSNEIFDFQIETVYRKLCCVLGKHIGCDSSWTTQYEAKNTHIRHNMKIFTFPGEDFVFPSSQNSCLSKRHCIENRWKSYWKKN